MATQVVSQRAEAQRTIDDFDAISRVVQVFIEAEAQGDVAKFAEAFHPDARMFGAVGTDRYDVPIFGGMDEAVAHQPTVDHDAKILSIDVEGDTACVKLAESRFWGMDFIDFFLLSRIDGEWQIVAKSFAVTGQSG